MATQQEKTRILDYKENRDRRKGEHSLSAPKELIKHIKFEGTPNFTAYTISACLGSRTDAIGRLKSKVEAIRRDDTSGSRAEKKRKNIDRQISNLESKSEATIPLITANLSINTDSTMLILSGLENLNFESAPGASPKVPLRMSDVIEHFISHSGSERKVEKLKYIFITDIMKVDTEEAIKGAHDPDSKDVKEFTHKNWEALEKTPLVKIIRNLDGTSITKILPSYRFQSPFLTHV